MPKMALPPAESMRLDSLAEVARGGMGSVELARVVDGRLAGQVLAVKRLHANIAEDPEFVSMFLDEAWMTAALKHPNVAQVMVWGNDDKGMFLAIELVQGVSLSRLLKEAQLNQEPFAERTVAYICSQICGALVAAHTLTAPDGTSLGLVHRDLTPANILISFDGVVKIIDFGIAKAEERISHTRTGQLKGKPAYMAPEQQRGGSVDARADLFAFGVLMFEMLAGRRPWTSKGAFDVMMEISNDPHPNLGDLRKGLNPEFVTIAHKCLEKKAEDRIQSAGEIKARLDAWLHAKGFSADDAQSLARFVLRNCQPQVVWWQEALRGEHNKKKKPTFKELEEKIDEERERQAKAARKATAPPPPLRPAAGRMGGTVPMPAYRPGSTPDSGVPPSSGPASPAQPISSQPISSQPISRQPISSQPISSQPISSHMAMGVAPSPLVPSVEPRLGSGHYPAVSAVVRPPVSAGTELMPQVHDAGAPHTPASSFGSGKYTAVGSPAPPPQPVEQPSPSDFLGGTVMMADIPQIARRPSVAPYGPPPPYAGIVPAPGAGYDSGTMPMSPGLAMANTTQPMPPGALAAINAMAHPGPPGAVHAMGAAPPPPTLAMDLPRAPPRRSRVPLVLALLVLVLGGAGAGLWFFGDSLGIDLGFGASSKPAPKR